MKEMEEKTTPETEETSEEAPETEAKAQILINIVHYDFKIFTTPVLQKIFDMLPVCGFKWLFSSKNWLFLKK